MKCRSGEGCAAEATHGRFGPRFCEYHYEQLHASVAAKGGKHSSQPKNGVCAVDGCTAFATATSLMCGKHELEYGTPAPEENTPESVVVTTEPAVTPYKRPVGSTTTSAASGTCGLAGCDSSAWRESPARCYHHRAVPEGGSIPPFLKCLAPGCTNRRRTATRPTCVRHSVGDVAPDVLAAWHADNGIRPRPDKRRDVQAA